jgi:ketosteroid isomerase-like protein
MILSHFSTALDAQSAFYEALQNADLAQMMAVWAEEEDIVCIHPGGNRHTGIAEVRESWRQIFSGGPQLRFELVAQRTFPGRTTSIHSVYERITPAEGAISPTSVIATNVFALSDHGWQMLVHHASQIPDHPDGQDDAPALLH